MQKAGEPENDARFPDPGTAVVIHTPLSQYNYIDYSFFLGCKSMLSLSGC